jgi:hypothetical protein
MSEAAMASALAVFATGVEFALYIAVMGGLLFATLRAIRGVMGIGRDT